MTLRLVLVSLVAALGLTIPGTPMIESWVASTQNWMHAKFADWDTRNPAAADYVIVGDYYNPYLLADTSVESRASSPSVTKEATSGTQPGKASVGYPAPEHGSASKSEPRLKEIRAVSIPSPKAGLAPMGVNELLHRDIALLLRRGSQGSAPAIPSVIARGMIRPRFEPLAATTITTLADRLNLDNEGIGIQPPKVDLRPRFEPIPVSDEMQVGVAYELNRRSEGIGIQPPPLITTAEAAIEKPRKVAPELAADFGTMESRPSLYFAGELATSAAPVEKATPGKLAAGTNDLYIESAEEVPPASDGFARVRESSRLVPAESKPDFSVISIGLIPWSDHWLGSIGGELIHRAYDFRAMPSEPIAANVAITAPAGRDLGNAVRLTREAVHAWLNVLTGPAIVTVSHTPHRR